MTLITVKLTTKELELLITLASDQLFRKEFIDARIPGCKSNSADMTQAKALLARLRSLVDPAYARRTARLAAD